MNTVILGAGESGVGAAILAKKQGHKVFVSDKGEIKSKYKNLLDKYAIPYEELQHSEDRIFNADQIVKSPGIPDKVQLIKDLKTRQIPVISEIEFAAKHTDAKLIAVTGSNGKTTTTNLIFHLMKTSGFDVEMGGNVGFSFAKLVAEMPKAFYVLELSSFQLDGIVDFRPNIALLLNITADHLDRYDYDVKNYIRSKFRIIENQKTEDLFVYNGSDENMRTYLNNKKIDSSSISINEVLYESPILNVADFVFDLTNCSLKGKHNQFNMTAAIHAVLAVGLTKENIQKGLDTFENVAHRLEVVGEKNEVTYINDSKATNVDAVYYALDAMEKPVVWIVGGKDKGNDYSPIMELVEDKVKAIICLGADNQKIVEFFSPVMKIIEETQDTREAIKLANLYAEKGDVVLLSPACASFDLFKNYEDRGDQFKQAVLEL